MTNTSIIPTKNVLNSPVTALRFDEQMFLMLKWARARESRIVCLANVHMMMEAHHQEKFASVLKSADIVAPDGMPLVWMLRQMGMRGQDRVAGLDVFVRLCQLCSLSGVSVYFVGSTDEILGQMREKLAQDFPDLQIAGMESLPFRPMTQSEDESLVERINASGAGIVWVCLGCPKQEFWMLDHLNKINAVMLGVGAVFSVYAGFHKRAPRLVRESGFEWFYRLIQEPRRLWHRYSQTIPPFLLLASQQLLQQSLQHSSNNYDLTNTEFDLLLFDPKPSKIGEILVRQNLVSEAILSGVLEEQRFTQKRLGEILIERKYLSQIELEYYLRNQTIRLGELLVENQVVSQNRLQKLLDRQKQAPKKLGELLVEQRILSASQLQQVLLEQYWRHHGLWLADNNATTNESELLRAIA
jgi:N-acetylglucosaminyldiphosphoundecaprenol N-acetyl-beta-D-mannosaminyltransferase